MGSAAVLWQNLADDGRVTASTQELLLPVSNVLNPHVQKRWRATTYWGWFLVDLGSAMSIDTIVVKGLTLSAAGTVRIRATLTDFTGMAGDVTDSGTLATGGAFDHNYGTAALLLNAPASARYILVDLSDAGADYVEAGRIIIGARSSFTRNFAPGAQTQYTDRSERQETRGGQQQVWFDNHYRTITLPFDVLTEAERYDIVEPIDRDRGRRSDVLLILDTESAHLGRDVLWGLMNEISPSVYSTFSDADGENFSKQFVLSERL